MSDSLPEPNAPSSDKPVARPNPLVELLGRMNLTQLTLALLVVVFVVQWFDAHQEINLVQQELAKRLADMDSSNKVNQTLAAQNQEMVREFGGKLSVLESKFAESQNQRAALDNLYQEMSSSRDQSALADVEHMLIIASQQLQLSGNVKAALIALQQADSRMQRLDRASMNELRKLLGRDIDRLRALPNVDIPGISLRLEGVVMSLDHLPLTQEIHSPRPKAQDAPPLTPANLDYFWREIWTEMKNLVRIKNMQKEELPLLSPEQSFFLRENLKLRLLSARLALLSRDETSFKHDIKAAQDWLKSYFDIQSEEGALALKSLQTLASANIAIELPDVGGSLEAVRAYRISHEKAVR
jgi:uroporphyrin-3 C-methyltransferase